MTRILAIETSCDETAAAVIADGTQILSSVVASQSDLHARYGGVFPEVASRQHVEVIHAVVEEAMGVAHLGFDDLDRVAVTRGPGLVGSLLVGVNMAKGLAVSRNLPLLGVDLLVLVVHLVADRAADQGAGQSPGHGAVVVIELVTDDRAGGRTHQSAVLRVVVGRSGWSAGRRQAQGGG